jgi:hypothetical protein
LRFVADVHHVGHRRLHAEREFILADAGLRLGIAELAEFELVQLVQGVETATTDVARHAGRVVHIQDRLADRAALYALENGR